MTPLQGVQEFWIRSHIVSPTLFTDELLTALGSQEQLNLYIRAYGPMSGGGGEFYDDKQNKQAAYAAQYIGLVPGQMFWNGYVKKGQAEILNNQFWWTASVMGNYAQFAKPQTRQS